MKKLSSLMLALLLLAVCPTALAVQGGDNQILPDVNTVLPNLMATVWEDVQIITVPYKNLESGEQLSMLICLPSENASADATVRPCVVMTRGSGLRAVTVNDYTARPNDQQLLRGITLAKQGYVVAALEFRGYTTEPAGSGSFPAALQDIRAGVRFLKANAAEYGIDVNKMGVLGQSSGGYESAMLGLTNGAWGVEVPEDVEGAARGEMYYSEEAADAAIAAGKNVVKLDTAAGDISAEAASFDSKVIASIDLYGIAKIDEIGGTEHQHTLAENTAQEEVSFMTGRDDIEIWDCPYVHTAANPFWYYDDAVADRLSMLFIHGTADNRVYPNSTEGLFNANKEYGVSSWRFLVPGAGHGGARWAQDDILTMYLDFFDEALKGESGNRVIGYPSEGGQLVIQLNGEDVTDTPWKLNNLTAEDKVMVQAIAAEGCGFKGLTVETIDDDYVVESKTVYTSTVEFDGSKCVNVVAAFNVPFQK